jgi:hypothetical protein
MLYANLRTAFGGQMLGALLLALTMYTAFPLLTVALWFCCVGSQPDFTPVPAPPLQPRPTDRRRRAALGQLLADRRRAVGA